MIEILILLIILIIVAVSKMRSSIDATDSDDAYDGLSMKLQPISTQLTSQPTLQSVSIQPTQSTSAQSAPAQSAPELQIIPREIHPEETQSVVAPSRKKHKKVRFSEMAHMRQFNSSIGDIVQEDSVVAIH